jgi:phosphoglycolate phosphatase-like HAD superfamily hydrolase
MIQLVLFDVDGTLIHSGGAGVKAFARAFASEFGVNDGTERLKFAGRTDVSLVREFFSNHQIEASPKNFGRFFQAYLCWLEQLIRECKGGACTGVLEFHRALEMLPQPPMLGLLTGNVREGARIKLQHYNLWEMFAFGAFADDEEDRDRIAADSAAANASAAPCAARKFWWLATRRWTSVAPAPSRPGRWPWPPARSVWRSC